MSGNTATPKEPAIDFPPWPCFTPEEGDAVRNTLLSNEVNYWSGQATRTFEKSFAEHIGRQYGIALHNGTVALEFAMRALGLGPDDEVIVSPRSFIASASAPTSVGAIPVFADIDPDTQAITAESIEAVLTPRTRAVIVVHLAGQLADLEPIRELASRRGLYIIEDCAQAHGAQYRGKAAGFYGDISIWSFCQDKIMTTGGEGGMVCMDDEILYERIWSLKDHGKSRQIAEKKRSGREFEWLHDSFGTNARMMEMQAVLGQIQLKSLSNWVNSRRTVAQTLRTAAMEIPWLRVPNIAESDYCSFYKCYLFVRPEKLSGGLSRDTILNAINDLGVPCKTGSCPEIYREKAFIDAGFVPPERLPVAKSMGETSLMFPCQPNFLPIHTQKMIDAVFQVHQDIYN